MEYSVRKVVMTGGSGPVGLALIRKLLQEGIEILVFQRKNSPIAIYLPKHPLLSIEYYELSELYAYKPKANDYDVFFHFGWVNTYAELKKSTKIQTTNIAYALDAVHLAKKMGCHTFIGAGSQAECGRSQKPLCSNTICTPETAYGAAKLCAGQMTRMACKDMGIRHIWTRILSVYGFYDNVYSVLISTILKMLDGEQPQFTRGEQIWDFLYVDDLAEAFYLLAQRGRDGMIYTVGSGEERTLREYLEITCRQVNSQIQPVFGAIPYSDNQNMYLQADISEIQRDVGWHPRTSFEKGICATIGFYRNEWNVVWRNKWSHRFQEQQKINKTLLEQEKRYREGVE